MIGGLRQGKIAAGRTNVHWRTTFVRAVAILVEILSGAASWAWCRTPAPPQLRRLSSPEAPDPLRAAAVS